MTPRWPERTLALLREMGVTQFWPTAAPSQAPSAAPAVATPALTPPPLAGAAAPVSALALPTAVPVKARAPALGPVAASRSDPHPSLAMSASLAASRPEVATLDWPALLDAVAQCQACGLCQNRRQAVPGAGHVRAHCMVVGEAPGEQEDRQGEPFVGPAGQLLDRMLHATGLGRAEGPPEQQVYIANVIKCRPPGNRNPTPEEVALCSPYLVRQVALVQPRLILAMGRFAAQAILGSSEPIGKLRGRVHHYQGVPVVVTYHPAYLLRQPADKALAWADLCLAREVLSGAGHG